MLDFLFPPELSVTFIVLDQGSHSYLGARCSSRLWQVDIGYMPINNYASWLY